MAFSYKSQETKAGKKMYSFNIFSLVDSDSDKMAANQRSVMTVHPIDDATQYNCFKFYNNYRTKSHPIICKIVRIVLKKRCRSHKRMPNNNWS